MSQPAFVVGDGTKLLLGRGAVYIDRFTAAGVKQGERFVGNCSAFSVTGSEEVRDKRGMVDNTNPLLARVTVARTIELGVTLTEFDRRNLQLALMGADDQASSFYPVQATTPIVDEAVTPAGGSIQGHWYKFSKRDINTIQAVKDDTVTIASNPNNVNYAIDSKVGRVYITPGGSVADASAVTVSYTPFAIAFPGGLDMVLPVTAGAIRGAFRFVGDPVNGRIVEAEIPLCQYSPDGELPLIGDDFGEYRVKGTILSDAVNNPTFPFGRWFVRTT
jgi:hypothetical protein